MAIERFRRHIPPKSRTGKGISFKPPREQFNDPLRAILRFARKRDKRYPYFAVGPRRTTRERTNFTMQKQKAAGYIFGCVIPFAKVSEKTQIKLLQLLNSVMKRYDVDKLPLLEKKYLTSAERGLLAQIPKKEIDEVFRTVKAIAKSLGLDKYNPEMTGIDHTLYHSFYAAHRLLFDLSE